MYKYTILALTLVLCFGCKEASKKEQPKLQKEVVTKEIEGPKSSYEDLDGNPIELSDYKGKKIFLNYWATWCPPCIEEMPAIENLQAILEKENFVFLLASDQSISKIAKFKAAHPFDFNYIKFNGNLADEKITALPVTIIYNEYGKPILRFDGGEVWDSEAMILRLKQL